MLQSPSILNLIGYVILLLLLVSRGSLFKRLSISQTFWLSCFVILFSVFAYADGDYYHYQDIFYTLANTYWYEGHLEPIYLKIADLSMNNYALFRLYIWGGAFLCILFAVKKMRLVDWSDTLLILSIAYINIFSYGRVTLGMAVCMLGLSLILSSRLYQKAIGVFLLVYSTTFHKSIFLMVACMIVSLIGYNMNRKRLLCILIGTAVLGVILNTHMESWLESTVLYDQQIATAAMTYMQNDVQNVGVGKLLLICLQRVCYYLPTISYIIVVWDGAFRRFSPQMRIVSTSMFIIITGATVLSFLSFEMSIIYYRMLEMSMFHISIFLAYCLRNNILYKMIRITIYLGILGSLYQLLYYYYLQGLGSGVSL